MGIPVTPITIPATPTTMAITIPVTAITMAPAGRSPASASAGDRDITPTGAAGAGTAAGAAIAGLGGMAIVGARPGPSSGRAAPGLGPVRASPPALASVGRPALGIGPQPSPASARLAPLVLAWSAAPTSAAPTSLAADTSARAPGCTDESRANTRNSKKGGPSGPPFFMGEAYSR